METENIGPALFFYAKGKLLFHSCSVNDGEKYGDFVNYPYSHDDVWEKLYKQKYGVDYDYYPRGRVVYRKTDNTYLIYYDKCMEPFVKEVTGKYNREQFKTEYDEHYQCSKCNRYYVI